MNLVEELQSLDVNDVGRWPLPFRIAVIVLVFVVVGFAGVWFTIVKDKAPQLARAEAEEQELRVTFENKQRKAANYDAYKAQLAQIEQSFGTMLRQPPGETELRPGLHDTQTGNLEAQVLGPGGMDQSFQYRVLKYTPPIGISQSGGVDPLILRFQPVFSHGRFRLFEVGAHRGATGQYGDSHRGQGEPTRSDQGHGIHGFRLV